MCKWGTDTVIRLKIASSLSHTGKDYWKNTKVDACISDIVSALQKGGIDMLASCCGHDKGNGRIDLRDGRILYIEQALADNGGMEE